jgi:hypothetical protein
MRGSSLNVAMPHLTGDSRHRGVIFALHNVAAAIAKATALSICTLIMHHRDLDVRFSAGGTWAASQHMRTLLRQGALFETYFDLFAKGGFEEFVLISGPICMIFELWYPDCVFSRSDIARGLLRNMSLNMGCKLNNRFLQRQVLTKKVGEQSALE